MNYDNRYNKLVKSFEIITLFLLRKSQLLFLLECSWFSDNWYIILESIELSLELDRGINSEIDHKIYVMSFVYKAKNGLLFVFVLADGSFRGLLKIAVSYCTTVTSFFHLSYSSIVCSHYAFFYYRLWYFLPMFEIVYNALSLM